MPQAIGTLQVISLPSFADLLSLVDLTSLYQLSRINRARGKVRAIRESNLVGGEGVAYRLIDGKFFLYLTDIKNNPLFLDFPESARQFGNRGYIILNSEKTESLEEKADNDLGVTKYNLSDLFNFYDRAENGRLVSDGERSQVKIARDNPILSYSEFSNVYGDVLANILQKVVVEGDSLCTALNLMMRCPVNTLNVILRSPEFLQRILSSRTECAIAQSCYMTRQEVPNGQPKPTTIEIGFVYPGTRLTDLCTYGMPGDGR